MVLLLAAVSGTCCRARNLLVARKVRHSFILVIVVASFIPITRRKLRKMRI